MVADEEAITDTEEAMLGNAELEEVGWRILQLSPELLKCQTIK